MDFLSYAGFLLFLLVAISIVVLIRALRGGEKRILGKHFAIVLYINMAMLVYVLTRELVHAAIVQGPILDEFLKLILARKFQLCVLLISGNVILQSILCFFLRGLFAIMLIPALVNGVVCIGILFIVGAGIINVVWFIIFSGALIGYFFCATIFEDLNGIVERARTIDDKPERKEILEIVRKEINSFLRMGAQTFFALGASVGVSMSILFRGGQTVWNVAEYKLNAISMVVAFCLVGIGLFAWLVKPYMENYRKVRYYYDLAIGQKDEIII